MLEIHGHKPYFKEDGFQLFQGDSLQLLKHIPDESVDMVFVDPPYNLSNGGFTCYAGERASVNKGKWDRSQGLMEDFEFHMQWLASCRRVLKPSGTIWISGSYHSIYACGFALLKAGFKILNDICWFKPNGAPNLSCRYFTASHETLLWAIKDPNERHTFHYDKMKHNEWHNTDVLKKEGKQMRSVWSISTARGDEKKLGKHPTQKPLSLLQRVVLSCTDEGDVILDPFSGSGTTGIAASMHGRHYTGIEIAEPYLSLTISRYQRLRKTMLTELPKEAAPVALPATKAKASPEQAIERKPAKAKRTTRSQAKSTTKATSKTKSTRRRAAKATARSSQSDTSTVNDSL